MEMNRPHCFDRNEAVVWSTRHSGDVKAKITALYPDGWVGVVVDEGGNPDYRAGDLMTVHHESLRHY